MALNDLSALFDTVLDGRALGAPWQGTGDVADVFLFSRTAWALRALADGFAIVHGRAPRFWVPDYFCNQSLAPLRAGGAEVTLYPVDAATVPDWTACAAMADDAAPDVFLLVHTFGLPNDGANARAFSYEHGAVLIEDAAHVLMPVGGIGTVGDGVFYSPHKVLGLPDGAVAVARTDGVASMLTAGRTVAGRSPSTGEWLIKQLVRALLPDKLLEALKGGAEEDIDADPAPFVPNETPAPSALGRRLLGRAARRLDQAAALRREADGQLRQVLEAHDGWQPFVTDWQGAVPYRTVMRCTSFAVAQRRFAALNRARALVESWPDLAPEVLALPERHAQAIKLRRTLLLFPVDAGLPAADLAALYRKVLAQASALV